MKSTVAPLVLETVAQVKDWRSQEKSRHRDGKEAVIGFVPTMGALHEGHMSLVEKARQECDSVVVSIFVNPLQFGKGEDYSRYPRPFSKDLEFCRRAGVDAVYHPSVEEMYPRGQDGTTTVIPPAGLIDRLCGTFRPGHFQGVATVVTKLFGQVEPDRAYFGEKDYQQLCVVKRMVADLDIPVRIVPAPTYREQDGLAMSSRNVYLTPAQRNQAPVLYETLCFVRDKALSGEMCLSDALSAGRTGISQIPGVVLQYLEACQPETLEPLEETAAGMVVLVAAKFGDVRLIDNIIVR